MAFFSNSTLQKKKPIAIFLLVNSLRYRYIEILSEILLSCGIHWCIDKHMQAYFSYRVSNLPAIWKHWIKSCNVGHFWCRLHNDRTTQFMRIFYFFFCSFMRPTRTIISNHNITFDSNRCINAIFVIISFFLLFFPPLCGHFYVVSQHFDCMLE